MLYRPHRKVSYAIKSVIGNTREQLKTSVNSFEVNRDLKVICLSAFLFNFGDGLFSYLLPVYMNQLNASPTDVGMLYAVYYLTLGITMMLGGFLADHFDQKKVIISGYILWIPVPLVLAVATNWNQLWLPMVLYGTFFGFSSICMYVLRSVPRERTMQAFGFLSAAIATGYAISPLIGGFLSSSIGKQTVFFMAASFFVTSTIPLIFLSRTPKAEPKGRQTILQYSFRHFIGSRKLRNLCAFFTIIIFAIFLIKPLIPQFMHSIYNQNIINLGLFGTVTSCGWIFFSFTLGKIGDKRSKISAVLTSTAVSSFSFLLIMVLNNSYFLGFSSFLSGASNCIIGFIPAIIGSAAPENYVGRWIAIGQTSVNTVSFAAPIIGGMLYEVSPYFAFSTTILLLLSLTVIGKFKL
jgi:MFS family permease